MIDGQLSPTNGYFRRFLQIEGAFVQGLGWCVIEELKWGDAAHPWVRPGHLFTQGPGTYKLPTVNDIPIDFRVALLKVGGRLPAFPFATLVAVWWM